MENNKTSRRFFVKSSTFGLLAATIPSVAFSESIVSCSNMEQKNLKKLFHRYPSIDDAIVEDVVSKAHSKLDKVRAYVDKRPELARATWDWGFGDWETAIGAASHLGRRDIIEYLLSKGARPDIFTFAALGDFKTIKSMIESSPGVEKILGPHGTSLMHHANLALRMKDKMSAQNIVDAEKLIDYLNRLGNANGRAYEEMTEDKQKYVGDYMYGDGERDGFSVKLNMRKLLSLGKIGKFGGSLFKIGDNKFIYNGAPSVEVSFQFKADEVKSLTVKEPDLTLIAKKVS